MASTTNLLLSAKSTRARIIVLLVPVAMCHRAYRPVVSLLASTWSSTRAFVTTCCPGLRPDLISCNSCFRAGGLR